MNTDGEYGALIKSGGVYTFTEVSGKQYVFLPNGLLNFEQDLNGNRITLGYNTQNQVVSLTYSNASDPSEPTEQLSLMYNAQGFVSQEADGTASVWIYGYDASGHLIAVTAPGNLTTTYTYDTSSNAETANALLSITDPDGPQQNYAYDAATGRLIGTSQTGNANPIVYAYLGEAELTSTDANGATTTIWFNEAGSPSRVQDALGGISTYLYDINSNLSQYTDAAGDTYQYTYDQNGNLTSSTNPLGQTLSLAYGAFGNLNQFTDAGGSSTSYSYDANGNLLWIAYPDGTQQSFTYDPLGNLSETIEKNGDPVSYQYRWNAHRA